jgi:hypothetical protein
MTATGLPPLVIEYARPMDGLDPRCAAAARLLVVLAVLSAACVAVCFLTLATAGAAGFVQIFVFAATLLVAVRVGSRIGQMGEVSQKQLFLDLMAGLGLLVVGLAPVGIWIRIDNEPGFLLLGGGYALMSLTTWRHVLMYRTLAAWAARADRRSLRNSLLGLGYVKFAFEGIWLGCCAAALTLIQTSIEDVAIVLAVAAFVGCLGYGGIWIWMIIVHARLATVLRRAI